MRKKLHFQNKTDLKGKLVRLFWSNLSCCWIILEHFKNSVFFVFVVIEDVF